MDDALKTRGIKYSNVATLLLFVPLPKFLATRLYGRAELTIGQTGQMPGASRVNIKILLYWFFRFLGCSPRVENVELFDDCVSIWQGWAVADTG